MSRCFIMQPFDGSTFDKRYEDVFGPAVTDAGLEPYRVDRDMSVSIPIDEIESGIRSSELCLAEISTDNPNVWFELGFAIAIPKEVVLICSDERETRYPFDVQHRNIILYKTESPQDYDELRKKITLRIKAVRQKAQQMETVSTMSPLGDTEGLSQHEVVALVAIMQNAFLTAGGVSAWAVQQDMNKAGCTDIAVSLGLKLLREKNMVSMELGQDEHGDQYPFYFITKQGEDWLVANQDKLRLRQQRSSQPDDGLPF